MSLLEALGLRQPPPVLNAPRQVRALTMRPRPYQEEGIDFLFNNKRAILSDAPGLGKTFQACEAAVLPCVISCPQSLVDQWADFINEQYPNDTVAIAGYGRPVKRDAAINSNWDWLIINHDAWRTYYVPPTNVNTVIADEFHHFRNREAVRSKNFRVFAHSVPRVYGLTATPVFKDVADLWHQLHILAPADYKRFTPWLETVAVTNDYGYGSKVIRVRNQRALDKSLEPLLLGRTYKQVGMFLPERIDKDVVLRMSEKDMAKYKLLKDHYRLEADGEDEAKRFLNAGAVLHELRKLTVTEDKIAATKQLIDDTPGKEPIVVFVWYVDTAHRLAKALDGVAITGEIDANERRLLAASIDSRSKRVRVVTMSSLSEGVDLSASRTVVFFEETYVPGQQYQAITRVIRHSTTGKTEPVLAYWVRHSKTVDQTVHDTARKRSTGNALTVLREALG